MMVVDQNRKTKKNPGRSSRPRAFLPDFSLASLAAEIELNCFYVRVFTGA
jgi:hypothetical protein